MNKIFTFGIAASAIILIALVSRDSSVFGLAKHNKSPENVEENSALFAHCWCSIRANGTEVDKRSFDGYKDREGNKCRNTCGAEWDNSGPGNSQLLDWAKMLAGACGNVTVSMHAAVGAKGYDQVRSTVMDTGIACSQQPQWGEPISASNGYGGVEVKASSEKINLKVTLPPDTLAYKPIKIGVCSRLKNPFPLHVCRHNEKYTVPWTSPTASDQTTEFAATSKRTYWVGVKLYLNNGDTYYLGDTVKITTH